MARFLKFKFLIIFKLNFNGGQFKKIYKILVISKDCEICSEIKFLKWCERKIIKNTRAKEK